MSETDPQRRKFSRIPFDVTATLCQHDETWETDLLDICLHGALIHKPENLTNIDARPYQLIIHLEGGPDIQMDVHIAHSEETTLGLACEDIDVDSISHLRRLVELNLGDEELVSRELSALGYPNQSSTSE